MATPAPPLLSERLRAHAAAHPDQRAVAFPVAGQPGTWRELTFSQLDARADAVAAGLHAAGLSRGDTVLLATKPTEEFYALVFGAFRAGVAPVFVDPGLGLRRALDAVTDVGPRGLLAPTPVQLISMVVRAPFRQLKVRITDGWRLFWGGPTLQELLASDPLAHAPDIGADEEAVVVFTSGSTGAPKGVVLTHAVMAARVHQIQALFGLRPTETVVETLLVYTILEVAMGLSVAVPHMELSKPATVDPQRLFEAIDRFQPSVLSASPVVWHRLADALDASDRHLHNVRLMLTSAAPIPPALHARLQARTPDGTELYTPYGATEAMPVARIGSARILAHTASRTAAGEGTCVGELAPGMEVRIVPIVEGPIEDLDRLGTVATGDIGEILVHGAGVSPSYRDLPEATRWAKVHDSTGRLWHRMGDLGSLDDDGLLWFCGRVSHRLTTAHGLVPAVSVEGVLNPHPGVRRTALVGVGEAGAQHPVVVVELLHNTPWGPADDEALCARLQATRWAALNPTVLQHPGFPTDARHNSKIRREDLQAWASLQLTKALPGPR